MDELLNLARQLRPTALDDHGLLPAIEAHVRSFGERTGIDACFEASGDGSELDEEKQTVIYRVAQEALTNTGRHARADHVEVSLAVIKHAAQLRVRDDGVGFDPVSARGDGLGLEGMAERARLVGGELDLALLAGLGHRTHAEGSVKMRPGTSIDDLGTER